MWERPYNFKEGITINMGLLIIGVALQLVVGSLNWDLLAFPINLIILIIYILLLLLAYFFKNKVYFIRWAATYSSAVPALLFTVILTLMMGLIKQVPLGEAATDNSFGLTKMVSFWPFVLIYFWTTTILGLSTIKMVATFKWRKLPYLLIHLGLFIAILSASFGGADLKKLTMTTKVNNVEWRGIDIANRVVELPLAIELKDFIMEEYPPKLMVIDNNNGQVLFNGKHLLLDTTTLKGDIGDWSIDIIESLENSAKVEQQDGVSYVEWLSVGATFATKVKVLNKSTNEHKEGWVSNGSFIFPYNALKLNDKHTLVMPEREAKRFASNVIIYTEQGDKYSTTIEVNKPAKVNGWKIYQLSYDQDKGKWSDISIFELVKDPWLPLVYVGIILMILGAFLIFIMYKPINETAGVLGGE